MADLTGSILISIAAQDNISMSLRNIQRSAGMLLDSFRSLGGGIGSVANVMTGLTVAGPLGAAAAGVGELVKFTKSGIDSFVDFESGIAKVVAATGLTGDAAKEMAESVKLAAEEMGPKFGRTAGQTVEAIESLVKAGLEGPQAFKALEAAMSIATVEQINAGEAANLVVQGLGQFALGAEEATRVADAYVNASIIGVGTAAEFANGMSYAGSNAHAFGMDLEETVAALVKMNNQGLAAEKAGRYLDAMFRDLISKSDELGLELYDTEGNMIGLADIIEQLENKMAEFGTQAERDAWLTQNFSSQAGRAVTNLTSMNEAGEKGSDIMRGMEEDIKKTGSALQAAQTQQDTTKGKWDEFMSKLDEVKRKIAEIFIPALNTITDWLSDFIEDLPPVITKIKDFAEELGKWGPLISGVADLDISLKGIEETIDGWTEGLREFRQEWGWLIQDVAGFAVRLLQGDIVGAYQYLSEQQTGQRIYGRTLAGKPILTYQGQPLVSWPTAGLSEPFTPPQPTARTAEPTTTTPEGWGTQPVMNVENQTIYFPTTAEDLQQQIGQNMVRTIGGIRIRTY